MQRNSGKKKGGSQTFGGDYCKTQSSSARLDKLLSHRQYENLFGRVRAMAKAQGEGSHNQAMETTENNLSKSDEAEQSIQM